MTVTQKFTVEIGEVEVELTRPEVEALYADLRAALGYPAQGPGFTVYGAEELSGAASPDADYQEHLQLAAQLSRETPAETAERLAAQAQAFVPTTQDGRRPGTGIGGSRNP